MLETLKIFVDLIQTESFSRAATRNYLTQSAVSQRIRQLESDLGQQLVVRGRGRMKPTEAGRIFYDASREILDRFAQARDELNRIRHVVSGTLRLATVPSVGLHVLPPFLKTFLREYPAVDLQLEYRRNNEVYEGLLDLSFDLGIVAYPSRQAQITQIAFREDRLVLICPPDHELAKWVAVPIKKLDGHPFIAFETSTPTGRLIERAFRNAGVGVRLVHRFDNIETIKRAVEIGSGVSIVPNSTIREEVRTRSLEAIALSGSGWSRPLTIIHKKGRKPSAPALRFIETLQKES
ncbi:MAG: LysR family transcriptional regulator [Candidatus Latescibacterota bacterium]|nr:MAG: LysR family transcriptional regulator [Candidatus Latescibacterota bacterium]